MANNDFENRQAADARREAEKRTHKKFSKRLQRKFHDAITGMNIKTFEELVAEAIEVLNG